MIPFLNWSLTENYKCILHTKYELNFYPMPSFHGGHQSLCDSLPQVLLGCVGTPGTPTLHGLRLCYEVSQPVSLATLPLSSAVCCHFLQLLICSLMNTQLLRSRSKNVSLSVPASSKVQLCP